LTAKKRFCFYEYYDILFLNVLFLFLDGFVYSGDSKITSAYSNVVTAAFGATWRLAMRKTKNY